MSDNVSKSMEICDITNDIRSCRDNIIRLVQYGVLRDILHFMIHDFYSFYILLYINVIFGRLLKANRPASHKQISVVASVQLFI